MFKRVSIIFILAVLLLISVSACDNGQIPDITTRNNTAKDTTENSILEDPIEPFTVIMLESAAVTSIYPDPSSMYNSANNNIYKDTVEKQLKDKGINIKIDIVTVDTSGDSVKKYKDYVKAKIASGDNVAFASGFFSKEEIAEMVSNKQILEISDIYKEYARMYYEETFGNNTIKNYIENNSYYLTDNQNSNAIYGIPIGTLENVDYPALLVKKDIADKYGKDIDTIKDYEDLLNWIKSNESRYKPGLFLIGEHTTWSTSSYPCYDLFAHANGYCDISGQVGGMIAVDYYYKNIDVNDIIKNNGIDIATVPEISGFKEFMLDLRSWSDNGLIDFWSNANYKLIDPLNYATIFSNTFYYMCPEYIRQQSVLVDAKEYVMYLFNKAGMIKSTSKYSEPFTSVIYISAGSKNPEGILRFIEWLYSDQENYDLFIYGKKGVDINIDDGRINAIDDYGRTYWSEHQFSSFKNTKLNRIKSYNPANWDEVLNEVSKIPDSSETSLYYYIQKNTDISSVELSELYDKYSVYEAATDNERLAFGKKTTPFLSEILVIKSRGPEQLLNEYMSIISDMPEVRKIKEVYMKYIGKLLEQLDQ